jgi:hypothetical protein
MAFYSDGRDSLDREPKVARILEIGSCSLSHHAAAIANFNCSTHAMLRIAERGLSLDAMKDVIKYHDSKQLQYRGEHGGMVFRFAKTVDGRKLTVVAETKKQECWILTGFYE